MRFFPIVISIAAILCITASNDCRADDTDKGFEKLFDGETLAGWDGNSELWKVADGVIKGETSDDQPISNNEFLIWNGEVRDFILKLEFRIADRGAGNSGIQYRSQRLPAVGKWVVGGYQADIERTNKYMGILYEERGRGILALRGEEVVLIAAADGYEKEVVGNVGDAEEIVSGVNPGEWQSVEIVAKGNQLEHKINGRTTVRVTDHDKANAAKQGLLALQLHRGPAMQIEFRNIRLLKLDNNPNPEDNDPVDDATKKITE